MLAPLYVAPLASGTIAPVPSAPSIVHAWATNPSGVAPSNFIPLTVLTFQTDRYCNRTGTWQLLCMPEAGIDTNSDMPFSAVIESGWLITMRVEGAGPFGLAGQPIITAAIVTAREYQLAEGGVALLLSGQMSSWKLGNRQLRPESFGTISGPTATNAPVQAIVDSLAGVHIPVRAVGNPAITMTVNGGTVLAGLLQAGDLARLTLRETWDDTLEFVAVDGAPDSGWIITTVEAVTPELYI